MSTQVFTISGTCSQGGAIDSMSLDGRLNAIPEATVGYHPTRMGAISASAASIFSELGASYTQTRSVRTAPDFSASLSTGQDSLSFEGFLTAPVYAVDAAGSLSRTVKALHQIAQIDAINLVPYQLTESKDVSISATGNVASRIQTIVANLKKEGLKTVASFNQIYVQVLQAIDNNNTAFLPALNSLLGASTDTIMGFKSISQLVVGSTQSTSINYFLYSALMANKGSFFSTLLSIGAEFNFMYAPDMTGQTMGRFINPAAQLASPQSGTIDVKGFNATAGYLGLVPPAGVIVSNVPARDLTTQGKGLVNITETGVITSPVKNAKGILAEIGIPSFVPSTVAALTAQVNGNNGLTGANPTSTQYGQQVTELKNGIDNTIALYQSVIQEYADDWLLEMQRAPFIVRLTAGLDLSSSWVIGNAYNVSVEASDGTASFTGLLTSISHNASSMQKSPMGLTTFEFAYVSIN